MPIRGPGLHISLPKQIRELIKANPVHNGIDTEEYLRIRLLQNLLQEIPEIVKAAQPKAGPGRPARPAPPRLPEDVERGETVSGFIGVYANGRYWKAFWDKGEGPLGVFDTPEDAALARYWYNKGRLSLAVAAMQSTGAPQEDLETTARQLGALAPKKPFEVGDLVDYDPVIGPPGPIRRGLRIEAGPFADPDGSTTWRLHGVGELVRQEDLDHAIEPIAEKRVKRGGRR
jgi:hypothetical protein